MNWSNRIVRYGEEDPAKLVPNDKNWRMHPDAQKEVVEGALGEVGWIDEVTVNLRSGAEWPEEERNVLTVVDGHLRRDLALARSAATVPVKYVDLTPEEERMVLAVKDTSTGMAETDHRALLALIEDLDPEDESLRKFFEDLQLENEAALWDDLQPEIDKEQRPSQREMPIDLIFTFDNLSGLYCHMAHDAGWKIGVRSSTTGERWGSALQGDIRARWDWRFNLTFIDNNYTNYIHEVHAGVVKEFRPKYATVRDIMSKEQCHKAGIPFYPLEQILEWADELNQWAENVIVIPKYDCVDQIPEHFMLGYSVPTSHGGTPLPTSLFEGRRVHLLGGSWAAQLAYLAALQDDVVSIDNNYIMLQARFGGFTYPDGENGGVDEDLGLPEVNNHLAVALAVSFGNIAGKVNEIYGNIVPTQHDIDDKEFQRA